MTDEEKFNAIKNDMLRGTLQERLGYDLYDKILNHTYEGLPPASKEKFEAFLKREPNIMQANLDMELNGFGAWCLMRKPATSTNEVANLVIEYLKNPLI